MWCPLQGPLLELSSSAGSPSSGGRGIPGCGGSLEEGHHWEQASMFIAWTHFLFPLFLLPVEACHQLPHSHTGQTAMLSQPWWTLSLHKPWARANPPPTVLPVGHLLTATEKQLVWHFTVKQILLVPTEWPLTHTQVTRVVYSDCHITFSRFWCSFSTITATNATEFVPASVLHGY